MSTPRASEGSTNAEFLMLQAFLASIIARLDEGGESAAAIADQLIAIRNTLAVSSNMHAFVAGDLTQLEDPFAKVVTALTPPMSGAGTASSLAAGGRPGAFASAITTAGAPRLEASPWPPACAASDVLSGAQAQAVVMSLSAIESSFLCVSAPGVGAYDPDHASLAVAIEYLTALEGDFWVKIRGAGLAYGELQLSLHSLFHCARPPSSSWICFTAQRSRNTCEDS